MAMNKHGKSGGGHGGQAWVVTFADLVSLLMAFFVMLLSFSVQDQAKYADVSGSMKDAFGVVTARDKNGVIERNGNPLREFLRDVGTQKTDGAVEFATQDHTDNQNQGQEANTFSKEKTAIERQQQFALAAASLKQAWQDLPDITSISDNLIVTPTKDGLNITIADQDGRAMFPEGSKYPFEVTRKAIAAMAPALAKLPNQISISGHTAAGANYANPNYGQWELSFDRADVTRQILEEFGLPPDRIQEVTGRGDTEPFFPNDPYLSANQRVTITVLFQPPPVPIDLKP
ncbi:MAG TPA: flagellar motor protein MotB [Devosia sp.]|nr:flagellar motor protein MotB [Devosia sp.]